MKNNADAQDVMPPERQAGFRGLWPQRWRWRISLIVLALLFAVFSIAWLQREQIAADLIDDTLSSYDLKASYDVESIAARRQVIRNLVIGDPLYPDLTAQEVRIDISYTFGPPQIDRIEVVKPRLYGSYRDGEFSLGSLDPILFAESDEPTGLPELNISIIDGRARLDTEYGVVGVKLDGAGRLDDGFEGALAATAPGIGLEGCRADTATAFGDITATGGRLAFIGPVRFRGARCNGASVGSADLATKIALPEDFSGVDGAFALSSQAMKYAGNTLASLAGEVDFFWRNQDSMEVGRFVLNHDLTGKGFESEYVRLSQLGADGAVRANKDFSDVEWSTELVGGSVDLALGEGSAIANSRQTAQGTLAEALLAKLERGLERSLVGGAFAANGTARLNKGAISAIIPEARLRSAAGETVLAMSRVSYSSDAGRFAGNIRTGGRDIPQITGRMEQVSGGDLALRMAMAQYRSGEDWVAIPRLDIRQGRNGNVAFDGTVLASGAIPGGSLRELRIPIDGRWSARSGLALWPECTQIEVKAAQMGEASLAGQGLTVCPRQSDAILTYRDELKVDFEAENLEFAGSMAGAPIVASVERALGSYPGRYGVYGLDVALGEGENAYQFNTYVLEGPFEALEDGEYGGLIVGLDADLPAVPLDISGLTAPWRFGEEGFRLSSGSFSLTDKVDPATGAEPRFNPLIGQDMSLDLVDGVIAAQSDLIHPDSRSRVARVEITHDLDSATGGARIVVDDLRFTDQMQPTDLSGLARGYIANAAGSINGVGLIEWQGDEITSSGRFGTDGIDFAAAFGPVDGVKGQIEFTDLINLTTAPDQVIEIGAINPGIEAFDGRIVYSMTGGEVISLKDARWPFMDGELILRSTDITYGGQGGQNYIFELVGLDAATFVTQMELTNIGATGTFDGTIPIYFDPDGNGFIQGGLLIARPPGGNVAYVGELTYEDLGVMGNYAFQTLRSLDYRQMSVELDGSLAGEIITRFQIDGIRQGEGTDQNFITRRLAQLPIRFKINVRSDNFYMLALIVRGLFDPASFGTLIDPEKLGLGAGTIRVVNPDAVPVPNQSPTPNDQPDPEPIQRRDEPAVQPPESDNLP